MVKHLWTHMIVRWGLTALLAVGFSFKVLHDWRAAKFHALNDVMVALDFGELAAADAPQALARPQLRRYATYFDMITRLLPGQGEAYGMRGLFLYETGRPQEALKAYANAIDLNPQFLWFYYNIGMIHLAAGDYTKAAESFQKALATDPSINAAILSQSKVFVDILSRAPQPVDIPARLRQGYELSAYFLRVSVFLAQNPPQQKPDLPVALRVF